MLVIASVVQGASTCSGLMAAAIAVCGFVFHAGPALAGVSEAELRRLTVLGGLFGLLVAIFVIVLSASFG
jgi:hypothetical protein